MPGDYAPGTRTGADTSANVEQARLNRDAIFHHLNFLRREGHYGGKGGSREFRDRMRDNSVADLRGRLEQEIRDYEAFLAKKEKGKYDEREMKLVYAKRLLDAMKLVLPYSNPDRESRMSLDDLYIMLKERLS